jgi:hypothetical protein
MPTSHDLARSKVSRCRVSRRLGPNVPCWASLAEGLPALRDGRVALERGPTASRRPCARRLDLARPLHGARAPTISQSSRVSTLSQPFNHIYQPFNHISAQPRLDPISTIEPYLSTIQPYLSPAASRPYLNHSTISINHSTISQPSRVSTISQPFNHISTIQPYLSPAASRPGRVLTLC